MRGSCCRCNPQELPSDRGSRVRLFQGRHRYSCRQFPAPDSRAWHFTAGTEAGADHKATIDGPVLCSTCSSSCCILYKLPNGRTTCQNNQLSSSATLCQVLILEPSSIIQDPFHSFYYSFLVASNTCKPSELLLHPVYRQSPLIAQIAEI